jgi:uncharacterized protein (TIGR00251 family)
MTKDSSEDTKTFREVPSGTRIDVTVIPRSSKTAITGMRGGRLLIRVTAPPVDDAANQAVARVLAEVLGVAKGAVTVVTGATSRNKVVQVDGVTPLVARRRLVV